MATVDEKLQADYWRAKFEGLEMDMQDLKEENLMLMVKLQSSKSKSHQGAHHRDSINDSENKDFAGWTYQSTQEPTRNDGLSIERRQFLHNSKQSSIEMNQDAYRQKKELSKQSQLPSILGLPN